MDHYFEFVWLPTFERTAGELLDPEERRHLELRLLINPRAGFVMQGTGGLRKLRVPLKGGGRRGGARVVYLFDDPCQRCYMILAYPKSRKDSLTGAQKNELSRLAAALMQEEC